MPTTTDTATRPRAVARRGGPPLSGPLSQEQLAQALAHDLDAAFEALVRSEQDLLFGLALRSTGDRGTAEEVAQDALVRAYRALAGYPPERIRELRPRAWLVRITLNLCRNHARHRRARPVAAPLEAALERPAPLVQGPEPTTLRREAALEWERRLAALPGPYRAAVELRHVQGLSYAEAAEALDRPVNTVKTHVHRGLALLRATLPEHER
jgi:RNA polymerase sigma-70 factor (ECF subfamily)